MNKSFAILTCLLLLAGCGGGGGGSEPVPTFRVGGEVFLESTAEQDADIQVRGLARVAAANDDFPSAQQINNPTVLGGYLSYSNGYYTNGERFFQDAIDIFALPALAGQTIKIRAFQADQSPYLVVDLKVEVFAGSDTDTPIFQNRLVGEGAIEFEFTQDDDYYVRLSVDSFRSAPISYQLSVDATLVSGLKLVPSGYKALASDSIVMRMANGAIYRTQASVAGTNGSEDLAKLQSIRSAAFLEPFEDIVIAEPDYQVRSTSLGVNDYFAPWQWNLEAIGLPDAWTAATGMGVRVAVLDTGIAGTHQDLQSNVVMNQGYDFVSSLDNGDGDGIDPDATELSTARFHGTHIAGIIAADTNDNFGIAGIAYNATIVPVRVLAEDGLGSAFDIAEGIRYAAGLPTLSGPTISQPVDIINLSLGLDVNTFVIEDAIQDAVAAGVIVVASAGNDGTSTPFYPAAYPEVIGVGAVNDEGYRSGFSNFGVNVDVMAPGGYDGILGPDIPGGPYYYQIGTSFAAPHVVAVAALVKEIEPSLTPALFRSLLSQGELTEAKPNTEYYGYGLIDASKAVMAVGGVLEDQLLTFPENLVYTSSDSRAILTLSNPGAGQVEIVDLTFDEPWLSLSGTDIDADGLGRYAIDLDRGLLSSDLASASVRVRYQINGGAIQELTVPVIQYVERSGSLDGVYVYLVPVSDAESSASSVSVYQSQVVESRAGQYIFDFPEVALGNYYLEASTDNDGDGQLFDAGEAIGAYRFSTTSSSLRVESARLGLSMNISYENYFDQLADTVFPLRNLPE